jgi:Cys-tRNA(Pro) deacylase
MYTISRGEKEVVEALLEAGCNPTVSRFKRGTETADASARELGVGLDRIVKSLVFNTGSEPAIALLPGDRKADMKAVARTLGVKKIRLADPDMVLERTGFSVGAVPPLGHKRDIMILMDDGIPMEGYIYPAAGERNNAFETTFLDLKELTGAKVCKISKES